MRASRSGTLAARAVRDPGIAGLALVAAVATVLCLSPAGGVPERVVGFWLSQTVLDLLLFLVCRNIFRSPELPAHMHRFWWALGGSGLLYMIGDGVRAILDAATVLVATTVFAWITTVTPAVLDRGAEVLLGSLLLPGCGSGAAAGVAQRFLQSLEVPVEADGHLLRVRASVGIAADRPNHPDALMRVADAAMYAAKRGGKNQYVCAVPDPA